ncbi:Chloroperoxidase [Mycena filopes]|nr:Chloroperoxidase [Mycena filopes]
MANFIRSFLSTTTMHPTALLSFLVFPLAYAFPSFNTDPQNTPPGLPTDDSRLIDVTGDHAFVSPGENDLRGPCPALNALANHNYIRHNGLMTLEECMSIPDDVWGFGPDFSVIACGLGEMYGRGDGGEISIGGPLAARPPDGVETSLNQDGLSGTHNQFESDSSLTRKDYYPSKGDNFNVQESAFHSLVQNINNGPGIVAHRIERYYHSRETNPYFYYGPVEMVISTLAHCFFVDIMANFDPSNPDGALPFAGLLSLFSFIVDDVTGELTYRPGHERIPANWSRRANSYTHVAAAPRLKAMGAADRRVMMPGGNMGEPDSFTPMDISDLTGGVYTEKTLFEGDNLPCFCFQVMELAMLEDPGVSPPDGLFANSVEEWMCPRLERLNEKMYDRYPGYKKRL